MGAAVAEEVAAFLESDAIAIWVATANVECLPQTARSMGVRVAHDRREVSLFMPSEQGARLLVNACEGAKVAAAFVRIYDYRAVQVKGVVARARPCDDQDRAWVERYLERFAEANVGVGMPRELILQLTYWPCTVLDVRVLELFAQTPGPNAGARL